MPLPEHNPGTTYYAPRSLNRRQTIQPTLISYGIIYPRFNPYAHNSNWHNELAFLRTRILRAVPEPNPSAHDQLTRFVFTNLNFLFPTANNPLFNRSRAVQFDTWLLRFSPPTQRLLLLAHNEYLAGSYVDWTRVFRHSAFVKREKAAKDGKPRGIQSADPLYNTLVGPDVYSFSLIMQTQWHSDFFLTYSPGLDQVRHGAWLNSRSPFNMVAQSEDYGLFDTTMSAPSQSLVIALLLLFLPSCDVNSLLLLNLQTVGKTKSGANYRGNPSVKSGDPSTTVFNTVFNGLVTAYQINQHDPIQRLSSCPPDRQTYSAIVGGDDTLILHRSNVPDLDGGFEKSLGLQPEYEPTTNIESATFLSAQFVPANVDGLDTYVLMPKVGRILTRFGWGLTGPHDKYAARVMRGNALGLHQFHRMPIIGSFISKHLELTSHLPAVILRNYNLMHNSTASVIKPNHLTHDWYRNRYGVMPSDYDSFDSQLSQVTQLPYQLPSDIILPYYLADVGSLPPVVDNFQTEYTNY